MLDPFPGTQSPPTSLPPVTTTSRSGVAHPQVLESRRGSVAPGVPHGVPARPSRSPRRRPVATLAICDLTEAVGTRAGTGSVRGVQGAAGRRHDSSVTAMQGALSRNVTLVLTSLGGDHCDVSRETPRRPSHSCASAVRAPVGPPPNARRRRARAAPHQPSRPPSLSRLRTDRQRSRIALVRKSRSCESGREAVQVPYPARRHDDDRGSDKVGDAGSTQPGDAHPVERSSRSRGRRQPGADQRDLAGCDPASHHKAPPGPRASLHRALLRRCHLASAAPPRPHNTEPAVPSSTTARASAGSTAQRADHVTGTARRSPVPPRARSSTPTEPGGPHVVGCAPPVSRPSAGGRRRRFT